MKKIGLITLTVLLLAGYAQASTLHHIRFADYPEKIRVVFDFDGEFTYNTQESRDKIELYFPQVEAGPAIPSNLEVNDLIIRYIAAEKEGEDLKVTIPLVEPVDYNIFSLATPPRLVIDFDREFINVIYGGIVAEGVESYRIKKGIEKGIILAQVLKINPQKVQIRPALARKYKTNAVESFVNLIMPWTTQNPDDQHFFLDKLINITACHGAIAGINGTFFSSTGSPLGALIIDGELISSPIYDRSAFFIDDNNQLFIDNVFVSSHFTLNNQKRFEINGINQGRGAEDAIMYTPVWGKSTGTNGSGLELIIVDSHIAQINAGNSIIPLNGYVISINGAALETLKEQAHVGQRVDSQIKLVPFSTSPQNIKHLISGGPRLIKQGESYVAKHEEKFRPDVALKRAARTAVGIGKENELLLITVDGPSNKGSLGVTLEELSELLLSLGAMEAVNLDGGSSSSMVIRDQLVSGVHRSISNAIVVLPQTQPINP
ncbi:MAG: phosphodiester glycosidase family protein [bacterium]